MVTTASSRACPGCTAVRVVFVCVCGRHANSETPVFGFTRPSEVSTRRLTSFVLLSPCSFSRRGHFSHDAQTVVSLIEECRLLAIDLVGLAEKAGLADLAALADFRTRLTNRKDSKAIDETIKDLLEAFPTQGDPHSDALASKRSALASKHRDRMQGPAVPNIAFGGAVTFAGGMVIMDFYVPGAIEELHKPARKATPVRMIGTLQKNPVQRARFEDLLFQLCSGEERELWQHLKEQAVRAAARLDDANEAATRRGADKLPRLDQNHLWEDQTAALKKCHEMLFRVWQNALRADYDIRVMDPGLSSHVFMRVTARQSAYLPWLCPEPPDTPNGPPKIECDFTPGTELSSIFEFSALLRSAVQSVRGVGAFSIEKLLGDYWDRCIDEYDADGRAADAETAARVDRARKDLDDSRIVIKRYQAGELELDDPDTRVRVLDRLLPALRSKEVRQGKFSLRGRRSRADVSIAKMIFGNDVRRLAYNKLNTFAPVLALLIGYANINKCGIGVTILESLFRIASRFCHTFWVMEHRSSAPCPHCKQRLLKVGIWYKRPVCLNPTCKVYRVQRDQAADVNLHQSSYVSLLPGGFSRVIYSGGDWPNPVITISDFLRGAENADRMAYGAENADRMAYGAENADDSEEMLIELRGSLVASGGSSGRYWQMVDTFVPPDRPVGDM